MKPGKNIFFTVESFIVVSLALDPPAYAGSKKNRENCAKVGSVVVKCHNCRPEAKKYVGNVRGLTRDKEAQGGSAVWWLPLP